MKLALTTVVIAGLIFYVAYKMLDDETTKYQTHIETHLNEAFK
jgi:hypothetical protein